MNQKQKTMLEKRLAKTLDSLKSGDNKHIFQNNTKAELMLPKPTSNGKKLISPNEQFIGDESYFQLVKTNELRYIGQTEKLLTEQPPLITKDGKVEHHVNKPQHITEDVLLTEQPVGGISII